MPHPAKLTLFSFIFIMKRFYLIYFEILLPIIQLWSYLDIVSFHEQVEPMHKGHYERWAEMLYWGRILANFFMKGIKCDVSFGAESSAMRKS